MSVKRYRMQATAEFGQDAWTDPVEDDEGQWVRHSDIAQARREALEEAIAEVNYYGTDEASAAIRALIDKEEKT